MGSFCAIYFDPRFRDKSELHNPEILHLFPDGYSKACMLTNHDQQPSLKSPHVFLKNMTHFLLTGNTILGDIEPELLQSRHENHKETLKKERSSCNSWNQIIRVSNDIQNSPLQIEVWAVTGLQKN